MSLLKEYVDEEGHNSPNRRQRTKKSFPKNGTRIKARTKSAAIKIYVFLNFYPSEPFLNDKMFLRFYETQAFH